MTIESSNIDNSKGSEQLNNKSVESELIEALERAENNPPKKPRPPDPEAIKSPRPDQTTIDTRKDGINGVDDSTLQHNLQVGGLGDADRVELMASHRVGYSPGTREPGSHEIFRLTQNFCSISRCFGANLTSRSVFPVK